MAGPTAVGAPTKRNCRQSIPNSPATAGTSDPQSSPEFLVRQATIMATAPPTCAARNIFEWKTCLFVRRGGSCKPRYVQKCTEEGFRSGCGVADSGNGGYCPINLCNDSGHGLPFFSVHVVAFVTEGASGKPAVFDPAEEGTASWQLLGIVLARKARRVRTEARRVARFTIAPAPRRTEVSCAVPHC